MFDLFGGASPALWLTGNQDVHWQWGVDTFPLAKGNPLAKFGLWRPAFRHFGMPS